MDYDHHLHLTHLKENTSTNYSLEKLKNCNGSNIDSEYARPWGKKNTWLMHHHIEIYSH